MIFLIAKLNGASNTVAKDRVKDNYWKTQTTAWRVWPIAAMVNYSLMPIRYRVFFLN